MYVLIILKAKYIDFHKDLNCNISVSLHWSSVLWDAKPSKLTDTRLPQLYVPTFRKQQCWATWRVDHGWMPSVSTEAILSLPLVNWTGKKKKMECSWVKIRTRRDHAYCLSTTVSGDPISIVSGVQGTIKLTKCRYPTWYKINSF